MLEVRHNHNGFTLIELMIGVVILAILFGVGAPSFMTWVQNSQIRTAAESISAGLQLARAEAVRRNTDVRFSLTNVPGDSTWTVACVTGIADLNGDGVVDCPGPGVVPDFIQSHSGSEGTSNAQISANIADVTFNGLGRATNGNNGQLTINVTNQTGGQCQQNNGPMRCLNILVVAGGQIRMCNPALPSTNPQGC